MHLDRCLEILGGQKLKSIVREAALQRSLCLGTTQLIVGLARLLTTRREHMRVLCFTARAWKLVACAYIYYLQLYIRTCVHKMCVYSIYIYMHTHIHICMSLVQYALLGKLPREARDPPGRSPDCPAPVASRRCSPYVHRPKLGCS